jgi:hypothetical protein
MFDVLSRYSPEESERKKENVRIVEKIAKILIIPLPNSSIPHHSLPCSTGKDVMCIVTYTVTVNMYMQILTL